MHCRLKDLLSQRLIACGWVAEVKERMQGQSISHACRVGLPVLAAARWADLGSPSSDWLSKMWEVCKACKGSVVCMPQMWLAPFRLRSQSGVVPPAEVFKERQQQGQLPSSTDLVQAVKPFGRSSVPDAVKAELLAKLTDFIA